MVMVINFARESSASLDGCQPRETRGLYAIRRGFVSGTSLFRNRLTVAWPTHLCRISMLGELQDGGRWRVPTGFRRRATKRPRELETIALFSSG